MVRRCDADISSGLVAQSAEPRDLSVDLVKMRAYSVQQLFASLSRRNRPYGARQETHTKPTCKETDCMTKRRLRDPLFGSRCGEAALSRNGEESQQIIDVLARHL